MTTTVVVSPSEDTLVAGAGALETIAEAAMDDPAAGFTILPTTRKNPKVAAELAAREAELRSRAPAQDGTPEPITHDMPTRKTKLR